MNEKEKKLVSQIINAELKTFSKLFGVYQSLSPELRSGVEDMVEIIVADKDENEVTMALTTMEAILLEPMEAILLEHKDEE